MINYQFVSGCIRRARDLVLVEPKSSLVDDFACYFRGYTKTDETPGNQLVSRSTNHIAITRPDFDSGIAAVVICPETVNTGIGGNCDGFGSRSG